MKQNVLNGKLSAKKFGDKWQICIGIENVWAVYLTDQ